MFVFFELTCSHRYVLEVIDCSFCHCYEILAELKKLENLENCNDAIPGRVTALTAAVKVSACTRVCCGHSWSLGLWTAPAGKGTRRR